MLDLELPFLQRLASAGIDDIFILAELSPKPGVVGVDTEFLSLTHRSITWGGQLYAIADAQFNTKRDTLESEPPNNTISFSNLGEEWYQRLNEDEENLNGDRITFRLVFASVDPTDSDESAKSQITDGPWVISGARMDDNAVGLGFGAAFNALKLEIPVLNSRGRRCQWLYQGAFCKSGSRLVACAKTINDCAARFPEDASLRFSAWPYSNQRSF